MSATPLPSAPRATALEPIKIQAKFFFEGDRKWFLKGVTYGPFKPNADGDLTATPEQARERLKDIVAGKLEALPTAMNPRPDSGPYVVLVVGVPRGGHFLCQ
jgi:hypothetical protein